MDGSNMNGNYPNDNNNNVNNTAYSYAPNMNYSAPNYNAGYAPQQQTAPVPKKASNALAIWALILGILSVVCCGGGLIPGIVGLILGINGKKKCPNTGMANVGLILSIIGIILAVIGTIVLIILCIVSGGAFIDSFMEGFNEGMNYYY